MSVIAEEIGHSGPRAWSGSVRRPIRYVPISKLDAARLFHKAVKRVNLDQIRRAWAKPNGRKSPPHSVERVLRVLVFDCLNYRTGRLDPGHETIARLAGCSVRTVARSIRYLRALKIIGWLRRCFSWTSDEGRFQISQDTNAYWLNSPSAWSDLENEPPPASLPPSDLWGGQLPRPRLHNPAVSDNLATLLDDVPPGTTFEDLATSLEALAALSETDRGSRIGAMAARSKRRQAAELRAIDAMLRLLEALIAPTVVH